MGKRITNKHKEISEKWRKRYGGCIFDFKNKDIILPDGSLFSIEKKKYKAHKIVGYKKLSNGNTQILFSKKRLIPSERYEAVMWMSDIDEITSYFKSMKRMLNKIGIKTDSSIKKSY